MRKIVIAMAIALLAAGMAYAGSLEEGFEGSALPEGWTNTEIEGHAWELYDPGDIGDDSKSMLYKGSYNGGEGELITPRLDLTQGESDALTFRIKNKAWGSDQNVCKVFISTNGKETWQELAVYDTSISSFEEKTLDLEGVDQTVNAYIKFWGQDNYGYGVFIDDVSGPALYTAACPKPEDLSTADVGQTSAELSWSQAGDPFAWDVRWGEKSEWAGPATFFTPVAGFPYEEGFENNGAMPDGWSQEYVENEFDWVFQAGGYYDDFYEEQHPAGPHSGSYNAAFVHETGGGDVHTRQNEAGLSAL